MQALKTRCCIAGGGPAGVMAGYILARAGIDVVVLEKHADFLRDFRGDTVHPSTLQALYELGLLERFLERPHTKFTELSANIGGDLVRVADFRHLPTQAKFLVIMPQWDFLNFLAEEGARLPTFKLMMETEATGLTQDGGRVTGVTTSSPSGPLLVEAELVIAADGRTSTLRQQARFKVHDLGAPIDVLWMRLPRRADDPNAALGNIGAGYVFVTIERGEYFQCAYVVPKGGFEPIRAQGLEAFRQRIVSIAPMMKNRVKALESWDDVKLLSVSLDRLEQWWKPGLLCIGDAAHAMSPVGGVGINLAIQDAVAAANRLAGPLSRGKPADADLAAVQARRLGPVRAMQGLQLLVHNRILSPALTSETPFKAPWIVKLLDKIALLRRIPARVVGLGFRLEHVTAPDALAGRAGSS